MNSSQKTWGFHEIFSQISFKYTSFHFCESLCKWPAGIYLPILTRNTDIFLPKNFTNSFDQVVKKRIQPYNFLFRWILGTFFRTFRNRLCLRYCRRRITLHERPQKWRILAKIKNLNCLDLFITQDYSGKQLSVD